MTEPLDLSGADTTAFDPVPAGQYVCVIDDYKIAETGPDGKMPQGTPRYSIDFIIESARDGSTEIDGMRVEGRHVFGNYFMPPSSYEKADVVKGIFVKFIAVATGEDEAKITSGKYKLDLDELVGNRMLVTVSQTPRNDGSGDMQNNVRGVKSLDDASPSGDGLL